MGHHRGAGSTKDLKRSIDNCITLLSKQHRLHRKIKFLLDIRGLLLLNRLQGDYVEFGVYRGEMLYAAGKILSPHIRRYIGLDTFAGLPKPQRNDDQAFVFESEGDLSSPRHVAEAMTSSLPVELIAGDFRKASVGDKFRSASGPISVVVIDANWPSSVKAALRLAGPNLVSGSIAFFDDYFVATRKPNFHDPLIRQVAAEWKLHFREFMTYPPFARAFLVEKQP